VNSKHNNFEKSPKLKLLTLEIDDQRLTKVNANSYTQKSRKIT